MVGTTLVAGIVGDESASSDERPEDVEIKEQKLQDCFVALDSRALSYPDAYKTMNPDGLLTNLNPSQQAAVSSFADTLAILAGPGSGKTHTLTARTAWLLAHGLPPWNIILATFTVKAAREMKERIGKLIGNGLESKLILGTFHGIARRYLARYGYLIDIKKDFGIADSSDSLAIIKRIVKRNNFNIDPKVARGRISGRKARGELAENPGGKKRSVEMQEFEICSEEYEAALERSNLLDYDDLLLRCVELLQKYPSCVSNVEAVLIDEFQDTNIVQFDLMRLFAAQRKQITIVGDPDQSIYGFRAAETKNYARMLRQYPDTVTIALDENYRSSGAILLTALTVIEQDSSRVAKSLSATHSVGTRPVLRRLATAHKEAQWLVSEIQRCMGLSGDLLDLNDFAILLRSASLSRLIESELGKAGIAYRMVGGLRFYDRVEVKTILDYLRSISQPDNNDALSRIINTPSRRIGESTIRALLEEADISKINLWALILGIVRGQRTTKVKLPKHTEQSLSTFVNIILAARKKISDPEQRCSTVQLIQFILDKTNYENWLENHHGDSSKGRWDNVQELMTQAGDFESLISTGYEDDSLPEVDGLEQGDDSDVLAKFLANVALASEVKKDENEGAPTAQVTISTIHAAKGLEWPVVFIPGAYQGSIPHSRAEDSNEERRLLYVAMTRAKALLYMSYQIKNSQGENSTLSPFLEQPSLAPLLDETGPSLPSSTIQSIAQILRRPLPSIESISKSSSLLRSAEDDLFPVNDDDEVIKEEVDWKSVAGKPTFTLGQRAPSRQRVGLGRSASLVEERSGTSRGIDYPTTMNRASTFTAASVTMKTTFVSASSHLQALTEHSLDCAVGISEKSKNRQDSVQAKSTKKSMKGVAGQSTLSSFLGKPEPKTLKRAAPNADESGHRKSIKTNSQTMGIDMDVNLPRSFTSTKELVAIAPALANRRLGARQISPRPKQATDPKEQHPRNDYVFLSSSPPRPKLPTPESEHVPAEPPAGLTAKPALLSLIRPATTMHTTTVSAAQAQAQTSGSLGSKRTLGVKRSMSSWSSGNGQAFRPPTMKRPL